MNWHGFSTHHSKRLSLNEVEYGVILSILKGSSEPLFWHFGKSGACAVHLPGRAIILGAMNEKQCRELAELTVALDYPGVMGTGLTTHWFADRASELGVHFKEVEPQQIYALRALPKHPKVPGHARQIRSDEIDLFAEWATVFSVEAMSLDPVASRVELEKHAENGTYLFWTVEDIPVSMAGMVRELRSSTAITGVYTPPELRGHGYAGAVTAVIAEQILQKGLVVTLYTDLRVPASNRCYARLGFEPACPSFHYHR
jgi:predicted GNAT family acetyltransferase